MKLKLKLTIDSSCFRIKHLIRLKTLEETLRLAILSQIPLTSTTYHMMKRLSVAIFIKKKNTRMITLTMMPIHRTKTTARYGKVSHLYMKIQLNHLASSRQRLSKYSAVTPTIELCISKRFPSQDRERI